MVSSTICILLTNFVYLIRGEVSIDYYGDGAVRNSDYTCRLPPGQPPCSVQCGKLPSVCIDDICFCQFNVLDDLKFALQSIIRLPPARSVRPSYEQKDSSSSEENLSIEPLPLTVEKFDQELALRHHIAHFCPNLDIARKCIRLCMKVGKPAFCGKDHMCYCGHRYSDRDKNEKIDVDATYNQFNDLYEKYFGPNTDSDADTDANTEDSKEIDEPTDVVQGDTHGSIETLQG